MNKNGFTLVEILVTVVLITLLAVFITPKVRTLINNSKDKAYDGIVTTIEDAAKSYTYLNTNAIDTLITVDGYAEVTLLTLQQNGLLDGGLSNPNTNEDISYSNVVRITKTGNKYNYEYMGG
jgi:prepilin-type N-terminal cleavage/methylation domain-containing protein